MSYNAGFVYTDASTNPNPGPMRIGYVIKDLVDAADGQYSGETLVRVGQYVGEGTVNQAEYLSVIAALRHAFRIGLDAVQVYSDSQVIIRQITGKYKAKDAKLARLLREVTGLKKLFDQIDFQWIGRDLNSEADGLSRESVFDEPELGPFSLDKNGRYPRSLRDWQAQMVRDAILKRNADTHVLARVFGLKPMAIHHIGEGKSYNDANLDKRPVWDSGPVTIRPIQAFPAPTIYTTKDTDATTEVEGTT